MGGFFPKNCLLRFIGYKMTSSLQEFTHCITDTHFTIEELNSFDRDGFIVIRGLADPIQVEKIVQVTDRALRAQTPPVEYEADLGYPGAPTSAQQPGGQTPRRFHKRYTVIDREVSFSLKLGDVVFFHALTFHAAGRNRSSHVRKSLLFTYRSSDNFPIPGTRSAAYSELSLS
jgi:ectoine hydroxylase-related dioxygenase (phytanoyl-CoA dioxygenase family)